MSYYDGANSDGEEKRERENNSKRDADARSKQRKRNMHYERFGFIEQLNWPK